jgi:hypothetical protein
MQAFEMQNWDNTTKHCSLELQFHSELLRCEVQSSCSLERKDYLSFQIIACTGKNLVRFKFTTPKIYGGLGLGG